MLLHSTRMIHRMGWTYILSCIKKKISNDYDWLLQWLLIYTTWHFSLFKICLLHIKSLSKLAVRSVKQYLHSISFLSKSLTKYWFSNLNQMHVCCFLKKKKVCEILISSLAPVFINIILNSHDTLRLGSPISQLLHFIGDFYYDKRVKHLNSTLNYY